MPRTKYESPQQDSMDLRHQAIGDIKKTLLPDAMTKDTQYELANCYQALAKGYAKTKILTRQSTITKNGNNLGPYLLEQSGHLQIPKRSCRRTVRSRSTVFYLR